MGMPVDKNDIFDIVGIGFGPSNLALAIAIDEQCVHSQLKACFLEQKGSFGWHPNMLLPGTLMQISFLKDLVTQRNPSSPYTFINYLKSEERLGDFINLRQFYPSRIEFNKYLAWAAGKLRQYARYGKRVLGVEVHGTAPHTLFEITHQDVETGELERCFAKNIVVAPGGNPTWPFPTRLDRNSECVWHSSQHLEKIEPFKADVNHSYHFAVVGRGQSAAEIAFDLHSTFPNATISCVFRGFGLKPSDSSEFVNEVFAPRFIDFVHKASRELHARILSEHYDTNYAVVDAELITRLYEIYYAEKVSSNPRLFFQNMSTVSDVSDANGAARIDLVDASRGTAQSLTVSAAVLATGYTYPNPPEVLASLREFLVFDDHTGHAAVGRHYRVHTDSRLKAGIYVQGCNEGTHGLGDTLLSNLAIRADEILNHLLESTAVSAIGGASESIGKQPYDVGVAA